MATMVKGKDREKKKTKHKNINKTSLTDEAQSKISQNINEYECTSQPRIGTEPLVDETSENTKASNENNEQIMCTENVITVSTEESSNFDTGECKDNPKTDLTIAPAPILHDLSLENTSNAELLRDNQTSSDKVSMAETNAELEMMTIKAAEIKMRELELYKQNAQLMSSDKVSESQKTNSEEICSETRNAETVSEPEDIIPSAPMFEEEPQQQASYQQLTKELRQKPKCMPLEEAVAIYGGNEMAAVKAMSEKEELIVEAGPVSGPEHPLVDLLSTFRSSLRALDNERSKLICGVADEQNSRSLLWKIEKRNINSEIECKCGTKVALNAKYEHATFLKEKLPVAKLRLESLLRDIQDSYCHHQHSALLAHCQIEELISETVESNKPAIREALSLVLQALRVSEGQLQAVALRRWAAALVAALVDQRDVRQILFVLHHLFRESRSVAWAGRVLQPGAGTASTLAVLDTLLSGAKRDTATECTEDMEEAWEEVSASGGGGAVAEDSLRERDLLTLFQVFPLRDIVARIVMFTHSDIRKATEQEWGDRSGGVEVMKACCGVRTLLSTCERAARAHAQYSRLLARLRRLVAAALRALVCLYRSPRAPYKQELQDKMAAELEACFTAGFVLFDVHDLHKLTTALLSEDTAKDYCLAFIVGLHDKSPKKIESLSVDAPVLPCNERVRIVTYASVHREYDHELATIVMDFLFQIGVRNKSPVCSGGCSTEARRSLPLLLKTHHYLRTTALYTLADIDKESVDPSIISVLDVQSWRPQPEELSSVLNEWARKCPALLVELLTRLDCTPFTGLSHPAQLLLSHFIVKWSGPVEARWRALRNVRTHAVWWAMTSPVAHAPDKQPDDLFEHAHALLATEWGHSIPLICNYGVSSLLALSVRPREAVHCLAPIMLVMAHSPESISLTPKFAEVFSALLNSGPSLVQRALGRGGVSGCDLLLRLALSQIETEPCVGQSVSNTVSAWLHALSTSGQAVLDTVAAAARQWTAIDAHAAYLVQDQNAKDHVASAVRNASVAPLVCECLLRAYHTQHEFNTRMFGSVANVLYHQQINGQKIHVDNALQKINSAASSEELVIYRTASAVLVAPLHHPAHLTLWRLFMHLYLQRPPDNMHEVAIPVGPLFFSGLKKSRTLAQLKKRLQETVAYHNNEIETYKKMNIDESKPQSSDRVVKSESITIEKGLLPELTIKDLTGESETESDVDSSSDEEVKEIMDNTGDNVGDKEKKRILDMACYHTAAERMMREYISWLEEGDRVRASPHHADIARFIPEQALEAAWQSYVSRVRPPPSPELDTSPRPLPPPNVPPPCDDSPLKQAVDAIMGIKDLSGIRSRRLIKSPLGEVQFKDSRRLLAVVDQHLNDLDKLAKEWCSEVSHISSLDSRLWELTGSLRVPRPLPPVTKPCPNTERKCKTVTFYFQEREWCISVGAERGIQENRSSWRSAIRRVSRPRPLAARAAASLHSIARGVSEGGTAVCAVERAFSRALSACPAALAARAAFIDLLAQRWICTNGRVCAELLSRWSRSSEGPQQALCGALVCPHRAPHDHWPLIYNALLDIKSASMLFSYLSKFDMAAWSKTASLKARQDFLSILLSANMKYGPVPSNHELIVLELVGVHTRTLVNSEVMCGFVMRFNTASCDSVVPVEQWKHLVKAVEGSAQDVPFDELDHLLQELGALWWKRILDSNRSTVVPVAAYAPHVAALLRALLRALVDAAVNLSYHPERVGKVTWASAERSWGGWVRPHPAPPPPLLPPEMYTHMLQLFRDCILMIMERCVGSEASVLRQVFTWCTEVYAHAQAQSQSRVRASEMLATLASLPWQHHWLDTACLERVVQISCTTDREIQSWCSGVLRHTRAETLCDVTGDALPARLATLLHLFTATPLNHHSELLQQATRLPWSELPEQALDSALDRFFALQYNCTVPYHLLPQFCVVVHASELRCHADGVTSRRHSVVVTSRSRSKRAAAVSQWTRAACSPHMHAHVALFSADLLDIISQLAPHLDNTSGELEELLCRASVVMCIEPAASAALPVWVSHMRTACGAVSAASVSAAAALTAPPHAAALADAALKRHLLLNESGWSEAVSRWKSNSPWTEPQMFVSHACVYAAYACALAQPQNAHARETLIALMDCKINFIEEEVMVAVWICYACRASVTCACADTSAGARTLLCAWAVRTRRSLLRAVTMQPDTACTTARHRLLCRLAECILTPSKEAEINYKTALTALGLNMNDVIDWGKIPQPKLLPRLAVRLYPKYERYFRVELDAAPESNLI